MLQSSSLLVRISVTKPEVKTLCIGQLLRKYCIFGRIQAKEGIGEQFWFVSNTVEGSEGLATPGIFFSPHLSLKRFFL